MTKAAAAAAVFLTVAETKAAAADGERPGPGPLLVGCGRAAVGPEEPAVTLQLEAPPPGRRRGPGPARTQSAAAAAAGGVGGGGGAMGGLASGGDVEPGLPVEELGLQVFAGESQGGTVSFVPNGDCEELAQQLAERGIAVRAGLHCAPLAHETAGTLETGTVRVSFGHDATIGQAKTLVQAVRACVKL